MSFFSVHSKTIWPNYFQWEGSTLSLSRGNFTLLFTDFEKKNDKAKRSDDLSSGNTKRAELGEKTTGIISNGKIAKV